VRRVALLLLAFALALGFVRLGFWQLHRAAWKQALIADSQRILVERRALPLADALDRTSSADDYAWVAGTGRFLPLPAVRLDDQIRDGQPGLRVYRVFQPAGGRRALLVEFGWRALASHRDIPAEPPPPAGELALGGLLSPPPAAGLVPGGAAVQREPDGSLLLLRLDPARVAEALGIAGRLAPRVLRLDPAIRLGYARDLQVLSGPMTPARHRGYAVQWFALALGLSVASLVVFFRKSR
jgi:cytochrome oxidase assembly protein ShyY1